MAAKKSGGIQKSAHALQKLSPLTQHGYIDVPFRLISDHGDYETQYHEVIKPQWNELVDLVKEGRYQQIVKMLERLNTKLSNVEKRLEKEQKELKRYQMLFNLLIREAQHYGQDKALIDSLGITTLKSSHPKWWEWQHMESSSIDDRGLSVDVEHLYFPYPNETFKASFAADKVPEFPIPFNGAQTWKEIVDEVGLPGRTQSKQVERIKGLLAVIKFRVSLIEAVLLEYEVLGFVDYYAAGRLENEEIVPDDRLITFIKTGIELYDKDSDSYQNRDSLIVATLEKLEWEELESKRIRDDLGTANLYNKQGKRGRTAKLNEKPLLEEMVAIWKAYLEKGKKVKKGAE